MLKPAHHCSIEFQDRNPLRSNSCVVICLIVTAALTANCPHRCLKSCHNTQVCRDTSMFCLSTTPRAPPEAKAQLIHLAAAGAYCASLHRRCKQALHTAHAPAGPRVLKMWDRQLPHPCQIPSHCTLHRKGQSKQLLARLHQARTNTPGCAIWLCNLAVQCAEWMVMHRPDHQGSRLCPGQPCY